MGKKRPVVIDDSIVDEPKTKKIIKKVNPSPEEILAAKKVNPSPEELEKTKKAVNVTLNESEGYKPADSGVTDAPQNDKKETLESKQDKKDAIASLQHDKKQKSAKYKEIAEKVEKNKHYPIDEATSLVKEVSYSKFDGTLEIHINTSQKGVRGLITLPFASGKKLKVLAFGKDAADSGADLVGDDAKLVEIQKGKIDFDVLVTTAEWMPKLARAASTLGPKGLMPNPKNGTITSDLKKTVSELQGGKVEYKSEAKANVVHLSIGKVTQPQEELAQNIRLLLATIGKTRIKKAVISPTMGPGIKLDLSSI